MDTYRNSVISKVVVLMIVGFVGCVVLNGCAYQRTTGENHESIHVAGRVEGSGSLGSGSSETKVGIGKDAVEKVMNADNDFNDSWEKVGVAEAENKIQGVQYFGPQQTNPSLSYDSSDSSASEKALSMEK